MARVAHADATEINGQDIERGVGGSLEDATQPAHKRVGTKGGHGVDHHAARTAAREGFHQGRRHGVYPGGIGSGQCYQPFQSVDEHVHGSAGTEHADAHQNGYQIRNDAHGGLKTVFGTVDERVIHIHALAHAGHDKSYDDRQQQCAGDGGAHRVHGGGVQLIESPDDACHQGTGSAQRQQHGAVQQVDALIETGDDDSGQRREKCGQQDGHEDVGGVGGSHLCPIGQNAHGDNGQSAGVEHQEHDHGVGGGVFLRVQFLQLLHGLQSQRCGGIVQSQHVGGNVHEDAARGGMTFRNIGKQLGEDRAQQAGQHVHHSAFLANLHDAEPECEHTGQSDRYFKSCFRRRESAVHHGRKHRCVPHENEFR